MLTYVYALVRAGKRPPLRGMPQGMPGGDPVRMLAAGPGLWLAVSTVPQEAYGKDALEEGLQDLAWIAPRALAHEAVVERFLRCGAVLPMQLFTLFKSDARAVEHVLRTRQRIAEALGRIEGHLEWGLRLTWDEQAARRTAAHGDDGAAITGSAYLTRKRDLLAASRSQWAAARKAADGLYRAMEREAAAARRNSETERAPRSRVLLDAAFLVRSGGAGAFRTLLRQQARPLAGGGIAVSLTGPWPPYNFV